MSRSKKFDYHAIIESGLIGQPDGLALDELLARCGLEVDRSTLFRHLAQLIERGNVERIGKARSSRYRLLSVAGIAADPVPPHAQPLAVQSVPEFRDSPLPNETPIPSPSEDNQLHQAGSAEPDAIPIGAPDYDAVVKKAVRTVVRDWKRCNAVNLQIYLSLLVKSEHLKQVSAAVEKELASLHQDDLARFGLSPADLRGFIAPTKGAAAGA